MSQMKLGKLICFTFGGLVVGDIFSWMILQPGGGRKVRQQWWGTRLEHVLTIPLYITIADVGWQKLWGAMYRRKGKTFSVKQTPLAFLFHCYFGIGSGLFAYICHNAYLNPMVNKDPKKFIKKNLYPAGTGLFTMLAFPFTATAVSKLSAAFTPLTFLWSFCLTNVIHFTGVKGVGFREWDLDSDFGLTDYEKELNYKDESI